MTTTKVSSKGQVIIPKALRESHKWTPGQELQVLEMGNGILLCPVSRMKPTDLDEVAGCLPSKGKAKSLADMENAISQGARARKV